MSVKTTSRGRSAGSMKAIAAPSAKPAKTKLFEALKMTLLMVVVTGIGLVGGALIMSPVVSPEDRVMAALGLGVMALAVLIGYLIKKAFSAIRMATKRRQRAQLAVSNAPSSQRSRLSSKTPRAVQALAASGAAPTEIAWKTGLPVDAVSMLLEITGPAVAAR